MNTFLGFGKQYVAKHYEKTGQRVYLHLKKTRRLVRTATHLPCAELVGLNFRAEEERESKLMLLCAFLMPESLDIWKSGHLEWRAC